MRYHDQEPMSFLQWRRRFDFTVIFEITECQHVSLVNSLM